MDADSGLPKGDDPGGDREEKPVIKDEPDGVEKRKIKNMIVLLASIIVVAVICLVVCVLASRGNRDRPREDPRADLKATPALKPTPRVGISPGSSVDDAGGGVSEESMEKQKDPAAEFQASIKKTRALYREYIGRDGRSPMELIRADAVVTPTVTPTTATSTDDVPSTAP